MRKFIGAIAIAIVATGSIPTSAHSSTAQGIAESLISKGVDLSVVQRGSLIWSILKKAKEIGDEGRRTGCFQRRTGWRIFEPPTLSEWACLGRK
jgi:hypothetical protein